MPLDDAQKIDSTLTFDDWDEIFISANGYWVDYDEDNNFHAAFERDDFFQYKW